MKTQTFYFKRLKSGNYEIATKEDNTHETTDLVAFFAKVNGEKSTTWDRRIYRFKKAAIIKTSYSRSQTYFISADELIKHLQ